MLVAPDHLTLIRLIVQVDELVLLAVRIARKPLEANLAPFRLFLGMRKHMLPQIGGKRCCVPAKLAYAGA